MRVSTIDTNPILYTIVRQYSFCRESYVKAFIYKAECDDACECIWR